MSPVKNHTARVSGLHGDELLGKARGTSGVLGFVLFDGRQNSSGSVVPRRERFAIGARPGDKAVRSHRFTPETWSRVDEMPGVVRARVPTKAGFGGTAFGSFTVWSFRRWVGNHKSPGGHT